MINLEALIREQRSMCVNFYIFFSQRTYNHYLKNLGCGHNKFHYTIAGRDRALLLSIEAIEDSWKHGMEDLVEVV